MNLTSFLHQLNNLEVDIWLKNGEVVLTVQVSNTLTQSINAYIQENKVQIMKRLLNNSFAQSRNWIVANFGDVYCYQYSSSGYIFIERNDDETVNVYRCKFDKQLCDSSIKGLHENISFYSAYQKAKSFLKWFYSKNGYLKKGKY